MPLPTLNQKLDIYVTDGEEFITLLRKGKTLVFPSFLILFQEYKPTNDRLPLQQLYCPNSSWLTEVLSYFGLEK